MEIKKYLTYNEIATVVEGCLEIENPTERMVTKDMYILKFATDLEINDEIDIAQYDEYVADGTVEKVYETVRNITRIDELIKQHESVERQAKKAEVAFEQFLHNISIAIEKTTKSLPKSTKGWEKLADTFKGVIENGNK